MSIINSMLRVIRHRVGSTDGQAGFHKEFAPVQPSIVQCRSALVAIHERERITTCHFLMAHGNEQAPKTVAGLDSRIRASRQIENHRAQCLQVDADVVFSSTRLPTRGKS